MLDKGCFGKDTGEDYLRNGILIKIWNEDLSCLIYSEIKVMQRAREKGSSGRGKSKNKGPTIDTFSMFQEQEKNHGSKVGKGKNSIRWEVKGRQLAHHVGPCKPE